MGRRGRQRQLDVETRYWRLLAAGVGTVEACRQVGVTRKTGYRWRTEHGGVPPERLDADARSHRYLSLLERQRIATSRARGLGVGAPPPSSSPGCSPHWRTCRRTCAGR